MEAQITWKILTFSSRLYQKIPLDIAMDQQYAKCCQQDLSAFLRTQQGEPGRSRRPGTLLAKVLLPLCLQDVLQRREPAQDAVQSPPADACIAHASVPGAAVFVFSVSPLPTSSNHLALES